MPKIFVRRNQSLETLEYSVRNKFRWRWLKMRDNNGDLLSDYIQKLPEPGLCYCLFCDSRLSYGSKGKAIIIRHANSAMHIKNRAVFRVKRSCSNCPTQANAVNCLESRDIVLVDPSSSLVPVPNVLELELSMDSDDHWEPPSEAEMKLIAARRERSDQVSKLMSNYLLKGYKMLGSVCGKCDTILLQDRQGVNYCVACSELDSDTTKDDPVISESAAMSMARELELASASGPTPNTNSLPVSGTMGASQAGQVKKFTSALSQPHAFPSGIGQSVKLEVPEEEDESATPVLSMSSIDVQSYTTLTNNGVANLSQDLYQPASCSPRSKVTGTDASKGEDSGISSATIQRDYPSQTIAPDDQSHVASSQSVHVARLIEKIHWASSELQGTHSIEYSIHLCQLMKVAGEAIVALRNARV